jgi:hypothetical protein
MMPHDMDEHTLLSAILSTAEASRLQLTDTGWRQDLIWPSGIHRAFDILWATVWNEIINLQMRGALPYDEPPGGIKVR